MICFHLFQTTFYHFGESGVLCWIQIKMGQTIPTTTLRDLHFKWAIFLSSEWLASIISNFSPSRLASKIFTAQFGNSNPLRFPDISQDEQSIRCHLNKTFSYRWEVLLAWIQLPLASKLGIQGIFKFEPRKSNYHLLEISHPNFQGHQFEIKLFKEHNLLISVGQEDECHCQRQT